MTPDMILRWRKMVTGGVIRYSGLHTTSEMTLDGEKYTLYTLIGSGLLEVKGYENVRYWMCGGGANGVAAPNVSVAGGGGGGGYVTSGALIDGNYTVTIGASQGTTSIAYADGTKLTASGASDINGASGGGQAGYYPYGYNKSTTSTGKGVSTYPFGITSLYAHSAGGGGGNTCYDVGDDLGTSRGGTGGSNGNAGGSQTGNGNQKSRAPGGSRGGGSGGLGVNGTANTAGQAATFYGSGGGGGGVYYQVVDYSGMEYKTLGTGGAGYQGVAYVLIPAA